MSNITTLVSLSMLKVQIDEGRDYFDYLVPFMQYCLSKTKPSHITSEEIKKNIKNEFGLNIPGGVCELVLNRIARKEGLTKSKGEFQIHNAIEFPNDFDVKRSGAQRRINEVTQMLITFVLKEYEQSWDKSRATNALIVYLSQFVIECLSHYAVGSSLPNVRKDNKDIFIVNSFVKEISQTNTSLFDSFIVLLKGHMLSNALVCPDLEALQRKFQETEFYFDTPLIMHLLGLSGDYKKQSTQELLGLLKKS